MAEKGTVAYITEVKPCDFCKMNGDETVPALYDAKTKQGPWANMCLTHFTLYGPGKLGTGIGQRLVVEKAPEPEDGRPTLDCTSCGTRHPLIASLPCFDENMAKLIASES